MISNVLFLQHLFVLMHTFAIEWLINIYNIKYIFQQIFLGTDTINRQAVLCHRVLRTLQQIARGPAILERETWESLLLFLIGINDALLAPPATREDAGEQLCERVLGVLLEVHK